jgi:glucose/arabinose dehydrogenase
MRLTALGLTFSTGTLLPEQYRRGAFIGEHGSWNRISKSGYKVIFVPFAGGHPSGSPLDVLTGFLSREGAAFDRPVGLPSIVPARCSSPMMLGTWCGG